MKLVLEIPSKANKKEIEKRYEVEGYELPFGIIDEILETLDFENMDNTALGLAVVKNIKQIKPLMLDIFDGLTEEELKRVRITELVPIIFEIFVGVKDQLTAEIKNVMKGHRM